MDIEIEDHGSIVLLRPLTDAARAWIDEKLPPDHMVFGGAVVCEPRYVADIKQGAINDGLEVG